jgi:hypothetical protein
MNDDLEDLRQRLDEATHEIAEAVTDVEGWDELLVYLLEGMELQAASLDPDHPHDFEAMLGHLRERIAARLKEGGW